MKNPFEQTGFSVELTDDGSPTLRMAGDGESMHHSGGAAAETQYIYKSAIDRAYEIMPEADTFVLGLGLGYIEISWALNRNSQIGTLTSFEKVSGLSDRFKEWLRKPEEDIYDKVCGFLDQSADRPLIKNKLKENFEISPIQQDLLLFEQKKKWNIICYDAFSSKTTADLWGENYLDYFLTNHCESDCVFTTYACTGVLKRSLLAKGFEFIKRPGFKGKRDSSLALRGKFKDCWSYQTS